MEGQIRQVQRSAGLPISQRRLESAGTNQAGVGADEWSAPLCVFEAVTEAGFGVTGFQ